MRMTFYDTVYSGLSPYPSPNPASGRHLPSLGHQRRQAGLESPRQSSSAHELLVSCHSLSPKGLHPDLRGSWGSRWREVVHKQDQVAAVGTHTRKCRRRPRGSHRCRVRVALTGKTCHIQTSYTIIQHHSTSFTIWFPHYHTTSFTLHTTSFAWTVLYDAIWYTSSVCICMRHVLNEVVFILMIFVFDIPKWVRMIHFSKWVLMYCRLCAPPHTQSECCQNCILCTTLLNDVIWCG